MTVKDFLEMDIVKLAEMYEKGKPVPETARPEPKTTEPTAKEEPEEKPKYNGVGNPMKLRKMCTDRGIEAPTKKNAAFYVDLLLADDAKSDKPAKKEPAMNKPESKKSAKPGDKLSEETYDKNRIYTEEQLKTVTARGLYNICRNVFDIPREKIKTKEDSIKEILKAQGGATKEVDDTKADYSTMGAKALYTLCVENGIPTKPKQVAAVYRELLEKNDALDESEVVEEDSDDEYAGFSELELFKLCKKIDPAVKTRQEREYYLDILNADKDEEDSDDEWGDDSEDEDGENWDLDDL